MTAESKTKTYEVLSDIMLRFSRASLDAATKFLRQMDDKEFAKIPIVSFDSKTKAVVDSLANKLSIIRGEKEYEFYSFGSTVFRIEQLNW